MYYIPLVVTDYNELQNYIVIYSTFCNVTKSLIQHVIWYNMIFLIFSIFKKLRKYYSKHTNTILFYFNSNAYKYKVFAC